MPCSIYARPTPGVNSGRKAIFSLPGSVNAYISFVTISELNPVERVWLYLKERFLSHRLHADYDAIATLFAVAADVDDVGMTDEPYQDYAGPPWLAALKAAAADAATGSRNGSGSACRRTRTW